MANPTVSNAQASGTASSAATLSSATYTVAAGSNQRLVVALALWRENVATLPTGISVTHNGVAMTLRRLSQSNNANGGNASESTLALFELVLGSATPSGVITASWTNVARSYMCAVTVSDTDQSATPSVVDSQSVGPDSVTSATTDLILDFALNHSQGVANSTALTIGSGQTNLITLGGTATATAGSLRASSLNTTTSPTSTMQWTAATTSLGPRQQHIVVAYPSVSVNQSITAPIISRTPTPFAPSIGSQASGAITAPMIARTPVGFNPTLAAQANGSLLYPKIARAPALFGPTLAAITANTIGFPKLARTPAPFIPTLAAQANKSLTFPALLRSASAFAFTVNNGSVANLSLALPFLSRSSRPWPMDMTPQTKLVQLRDPNPYPPSIPESIKDLSPDLYEYLQYQASTLRKQSGLLQSGADAWPIEYLTLTAASPAYALGSKGRFQHPVYGVLRAVYCRFLDMLPIAGAPVGFILGTSWSVSNDISWSSGDRAAGVIPGDAPSEGQYGWVLTDGFNLLPLALSSGVPETGRELIWSGSGTVSYDSQGVVIGRIVGSTLAAGSIMLGLGTGNGAAVSKGFAQRITTLEAANGTSSSRISIIETTLANGSLATTTVVNTLQSQVDAVSADVVDVRRSAAASDRALAAQTTSLQVSLTALITAEVSRAIAAESNLTSSFGSIADQLRVQFGAASANAATALSQISVLTSDQYSLAQSVLNLSGQVDDPTTGLSATADALTTLSALVYDPGTGLTAITARTVTLESKVSRPPQLTNQIGNSSLRYDDYGWLFTRGGRAAATGAPAQYGIYLGAGAAAQYYPNIDQVAAGRFPITTGDMYLAGYVTRGASETASLVVQCYDSAGTVIGGPSITFNTGTAFWAKVEGRVTLPAGTVEAQVYVLTSAVTTYLWLMLLEAIPIDSSMTNTIARIATEETTRATKDTALAASILQLQARLGDYLTSNAFFGAWTNGGGTIPDFWDNWNDGATNTLVAGTRSPNAFQQSVVLSGINRGISTIALGSIMAGSVYFLEADVRLVAGSFSGAGTFCDWFNAAGVFISSTAVPFDSTPTVTGSAPGSGTPGLMYHWRTLVTAPAGAATCKIYALTGWAGFAANPTTKTLEWHACGLRSGNDTDAGLIQERVVRANADSAIASDVTSLTTTVGGHTTSIASQLSSINGIQAKYSLTIDANGRIAGFDLIGGGAASAFNVRADQIKFWGPSGSGGLAPFAVDTTTGEVQIAGRLIIDTGTYVMAQGKGFGTSNQFMQWFGPKMALNLMSESNGLFWLKNTGQAYYAGGFAAGILTTRAGTSDTTATANCETPIYGSNGGVITVALGFSTTNTFRIDYTASQLTNFNTDKATISPAPTLSGGVWTSGGSTTAGSITVTLSRSYNGGSYSVVATASDTGSWTFEGVAPNGTDPGYTLRTETHRGSLTYVDPTSSVLTRQYKAIMTARTLKFTAQTIVQTVSIVSNE